MLHDFITHRCNELVSLALGGLLLGCQLVGGSLHFLLAALLLGLLLLCALRGVLPVGLGLQVLRATVGRVSTGCFFVSGFKTRELRRVWWRLLLVSLADVVVKPWLI